jgi:hypothetical protein
MRIHDIDPTELFEEEDLKRIEQAAIADEWSSPMTLVEVLQDMGRRLVVFEKDDKSNVIFRLCPLYHESMKNKPEINDKFQEFLGFKRENPIMPYGKSDTQFISSGPIGLTGLKLRHAHLNQNLSVVYRLHGSNPHIFDIYGVFSHKELGTGTTAHKKQQKKMAKKFQNQQCK